MYCNIADALRQIKSNTARILEADTIVRLCCEVGHRWRQRQLDPVTTLHGFLLQVLHGNVACSHVPHLLGKNVSAKLMVWRGPVCQWCCSTGCSAK